MLPKSEERQHQPWERIRFFLYILACFKDDSPTSLFRVSCSLPFPSQPLFQSSLVFPSGWICLAAMLFLARRNGSLSISPRLRDCACRREWRAVQCLGVLALSLRPSTDWHAVSTTSPSNSRYARRGQGRATTGRTGLHVHTRSLCIWLRRDQVPVCGYIARMRRPWECTPMTTVRCMSFGFGGGRICPSLSPAALAEKRILSSISLAPSVSLAVFSLSLFHSSSFLAASRTLSFLWRDKRNTWKNDVLWWRTRVACVGDVFCYPG